MIAETLRKTTANSHLTPEVATSYAKTILTLAVTKQDINILEELALSINYLLFSEEDESTISRGEIIAPVLNMICDLLKQTQSILASGFILGCLTKALIKLTKFPNYSKVLLNVLMLSLPFLLNIVSQLGIFSKEIANYSKIDSELIKVIDIIYHWFDANFDIFDKTAESNCLEGYFKSKDFATACVIAIQTVIPISSQQSNSLLSITGIKLLDSKFNSMKEISLQLVNSIIHRELESKSRVEFKNLTLYDCCGKLFPSIGATLTFLCVTDSDNLEKRVKTKASSKVIAQLLAFLTNFAVDNNFYGIFYKERKDIIVNIILVLLRSTAKELNDMKTNVKNFLNLAADICDSKESDITKVEAAKLLYYICDNIDGSLIFTCTFCCEAIKSTYTHEVTSTLSQYSTSSPFLMKTSPEIIIETCLLAIAAVFKQIAIREDLLSLIEKFLTENAMLLFSNSSAIVKSRLALLFGCYRSNLFNLNKELFEMVVKFLLTGISTEEAVASQCADSLQNIIKGSESNPKTKDFVDIILAALCDMVPVVSLPGFYELIIKIIEKYPSSINVKLIPLIQTLISKINQEFKEISERQIRITDGMTQAWNLLKAICEQTAFFPTFLNDIEQLISPTFNYLTHAKNIDFDDDIIQVMKLLIEHREAISENMKTAFVYLTFVIKKYQMSIMSVLRLLNVYVYYGKEVIASNKEWLELCIKFGVDALFTKWEPAEQRNTEGAIFFQIILQNINSTALASYIPNIISHLLKRLDEGSTERYLSRELINALLCSMYNNVKITLSNLQGLNVTEKIFEMLFESIPQYENTYDIKVLVIALTTLLIEPELPPCLNTARLKILITILDALEKQSKKDLVDEPKEDEIMEIVKYEEQVGEDSS